MTFKKYRATKKNCKLLAQALEILYGKIYADYGYLEADYPCWKADNWYRMFSLVVNFKMQELEKENIA